MKVYVGDITKADADVVVNAADVDFTPGGGVARWIKKQGGEEIFREAIKYAPGKIGKSYITTAGELDAKAVIHIPTIDWANNIRLSLPEVHQAAVVAIDAARSAGYASIVFPLLGAGTVGLDEKEVVAELADAILFIEKEDASFWGGIAVLNEQVFATIQEALPENAYERIDLT